MPPILRDEVNFNQLSYLKRDAEVQRYTLTEYEDASPATREVYDDFMRTTGATSPPV